LHTIEVGAHNGAAVAGTELSPARPQPETPRMARIDESRPFIPVNIAVLTVSDTRTLASDTSGAALADRIVKAGHRVAVRAIEKDETAAIEILLRRWIADPEID